jgi:hypothetical protein
MIDIVSADTHDKADGSGHQAHTRAPAHGHLAQDAGPTSNGNDLQIPTRKGRHVAHKEVANNDTFV